MTQPPIDPAGREPLADASPTEPVPVVTPPAGAPAFAAPEFAASEGARPTGPMVPPAGAAGGPVPSAFGFAPVEPEPGPGTFRPAPVTGTPAARGGGSERIVNLALVAAIVVGASGIAFAAGRVTAQASGRSSVPTANGGGITPNGNGGTGNGNVDPGTGPGNGGTGNGGPGAGGNLPDASFDLNGNGNEGRGPGDDDEGGFGFDRGFRGGAGLSGTVTSVTDESITIQTDGGQELTFSLDGTTTYHQQDTASAGDVTTGTKVQIAPSGRIRPTQDANGNISLGNAGTITIVP